MSAFLSAFHLDDDGFARGVDALESAFEGQPLHAGDNHLPFRWFHRQLRDRGAGLNLITSPQLLRRLLDLGAFTATRPDLGPHPIHITTPECWQAWLAGYRRDHPRRSPGDSPLSPAELGQVVRAVAPDPAMPGATATTSKKRGPSDEMLDRARKIKGMRAQKPPVTWQRIANELDVTEDTARKTWARLGHLVEDD